jgi:hypothetical protein
MAIFINQRQVFFGFSMELASFESLVAEHLRRWPTTPTIETQGCQLIQNGFIDAELREFVKAVCRWGNYSGIAARVLNHKNNTLESIRSALQEALRLLSPPMPDHRGALLAVNRLHSLGTPSFASKHLRFLRPDICPVLDSAIREGMAYSFDPDGYQEFAKDCIILANELQNARIKNPRNRLDGRWFAADVEMALYAYLNDWLVGA